MKIPHINFTKMLLDLLDQDNVLKSKNEAIITEKLVLFEKHIGELFGGKLTVRIEFDERTTEVKLTEELLKKASEVRILTQRVEDLSARISILTRCRNS